MFRNKHKPQRLCQQRMPDAQESSKLVRVHLGGADSTCQGPSLGARKAGCDHPGAAPHLGHAPISSHTNRKGVANSKSVALITHKS